MRGRKTAVKKYENGFIVLLSPSEYFGRPDITAQLAAKGLVLGEERAGLL